MEGLPLETHKLRRFKARIDGGSSGPGIITLGKQSSPVFFVDCLDTSLDGPPDVGVQLFNHFYLALSLLDSHWVIRLGDTVPQELD